MVSISACACASVDARLQARDDLRVVIVANGSRSCR